MNWNYVYAAIAVLLLLGVGVVYLFVIQNGARTTQLSLNLFVLAYELKQPIQIPALIGITAGVSFAVGLVPTLIWGMGKASKARRLEREIALSGGDQDAWRS